MVALDSWYASFAERLLKGLSSTVRCPRPRPVWRKMESTFWLCETFTSEGRPIRIGLSRVRCYSTSAGYYGAPNEFHTEWSWHIQGDGWFAQSTKDLPSLEAAQAASLAAVGL